MDASLLVPTPDDPEAPGTWTLVERDVLSVLLDEDAEGLIQPVFTSVHHLEAWRPEGGCYVQRPARWVLGVAAADTTGRVAVDPGSPDPLVLGPSEVALLAEGLDPWAGAASAAAGAGGEVPVLVATPTQPLPDDVTAAVHGALAAEPSVTSAKLFLIDAGSDRSTVVFVDLGAPLDGVEFDVGAVMTRVVQAVASRTSDATGLRFQIVTDDWRQTYEAGGIEIL